MADSGGGYIGCQRNQCACRTSQTKNLSRVACILYKSNLPPRKSVGSEISVVKTVIFDDDLVSKFAGGRCGQEYSLGEVDAASL